MSQATNIDRSIRYLFLSCKVLAKADAAPCQGIHCIPLRSGIFQTQTFINAPFRKMCIFIRYRTYPLCIKEGCFRSQTELCLTAPSRRFFLFVPYADTPIVTRHRAQRFTSILHMLTLCGCHLATLPHHLFLAIECLRIYFYGISRLHCTLLTGHLPAKMRYPFSQSQRFIGHLTGETSNINGLQRNRCKP